MSAPDSTPLEVSISAILDAHFENCENPHETIYRIWLLLQPAELGADATGPMHSRGRVH
jgi:hypothetical protein